MSPFLLRKSFSVIRKQCHRCYCIWQTVFAPGLRRAENRGLWAPQKEPGSLKTDQYFSDAFLFTLRESARPTVSASS